MYLHLISRVLPELGVGWEKFRSIHHKIAHSDCLRIYKMHVLNLELRSPRQKIEPYLRCLLSHLFLTPYADTNPKPFEIVSCGAWPCKSDLFKQNEGTPSPCFKSKSGQALFPGGCGGLAPRKRETGGVRLAAAYCLIVFFSHSVCQFALFAVFLLLLAVECLEEGELLFYRLPS
jgi:hypothetical protein